MECDAKVVAIFGGVRGGKTSFIADTILSAALMYGGEGAQVWWVAPTQDKTNIGLNKLAHGEVTGKGKMRQESKPLIPEILLRYVPKSPKSDNNYIELIDGTKIWFKYASKDGGNLKGEAPVLAVLDEGCEVDHETNYGELNRRLAQGDGQLLIATTPVAGHWLKGSVYDIGVEVKDWKPGDLIAWTHITAFDNPWFHIPFIQKEIDRCMKKGGQQEVDREIYGKWVGLGAALWTHFREEDHIIQDVNYRRPADLGLIDVTQDAIAHFFLGQRPARYLGMDFNLHPMSAVEIQVAYHPADPKRTPIVIIPDEVVKKVGTIYEHMDELTLRGYAGAGVSCDATGAQFNSYRLSHGIKDKNSTQALEMQRRGFLCQPCRIGQSGTPSNPGQLERVGIVHRLHMERIELPDGTRFPRFLIHQRAAKSLIALRVQESDDRGNPAKESNTVSDRISGPADGFGYGIYPLESFLFPDSGRGVRLE